MTAPLSLFMLRGFCYSLISRKMVVCRFRVSLWGDTAVLQFLFLDLKRMRKTYYGDHVLRMSLFCSELSESYVFDTYSISASPHKNIVDTPMRREKYVEFLRVLFTLLKRSPRADWTLYDEVLIAHSPDSNSLYTVYLVRPMLLVAMWTCFLNILKMIRGTIRSILS